MQESSKSVVLFTCTFVAAVAIAQTVAFVSLLASIASFSSLVLSYLNCENTEAFPCEACGTAIFAAWLFIGRRRQGCKAP